MVEKNNQVTSDLPLRLRQRDLLLKRIPPASRMSRAGWALITIFSLTVDALVSHYPLFNPATYLPDQRDVYLHHELVLGLHVTGAMLALSTGPFQYAARHRCRSTRAYRALSGVYLAGSTAAAIAGLVLARIAQDGPIASFGFMSLALGWLITTWTAVAMLQAGRIADYRRWMIRSSSLMFAGVTFRLMLGT
jgi:uncharacterized membrane protein